MRKFAFLELNVTVVSWLFVVLELALMAYQLFVFYSAESNRKNGAPLIILLLLLVWNCTIGVSFTLIKMVLINMVVLVISVVLMFVSLFYKAKKEESPELPVLPEPSKPEMEQSVNLCVTNSLLYNLSTREIQVVELIRKGHKNRQIAEELFIAEKTVESHIQNIFQKVGERSKIAVIHKLSQPVQ